MMDKAHRLQIRTAALDAFDRTHRRRRVLRTAASSCAAAAMVAAAAVVAWPARSPAKVEIAQATAALPSFVEIIGSDADLVRELDAAGSCAGVGRDGNRVFIVPCAAQEPNVHES